jgi:hypothetical protein
MKVPVGFRFRETMSGTWQGQGGQGGRILFEVDALATDVLRYLRDSTLILDGVIDAAGLATRVPARGSLLLAPLARKLIAYELAFSGDDARPYRLQGEKHLEMTGIARTLTTLPAVLIDVESKQEIGRATLQFDWRADLASFLTSWKPVLSL